MKPLKLEIDQETAKGRYANVALITHTRNEFIFDFALAYPQQAPAVVSRVVTNPEHAKAFLKSLEDNLRRFESRFGPIDDPPARDTPQN